MRGGSTRLAAAALAAAASAVLASCGGQGSGGGAGGVTGAVTSAHARVQPNGVVVASAQVRVSGPAGDRLTLRWGLVDAGTGNDSEPEKLAARYRLTPDQTDHDVTVRIPRPGVSSRYLVHFALYRPDGTFVAGADTQEFDDG